MNLKYSKNQTSNEKEENQFEDDQPFVLLLQINRDYFKIAKNIDLAKLFTVSTIHVYWICGLV